MDFHNPGNHLQRIDKAWMFISVDATGEGVCAFPLRDGMISVPMIAADEAMLVKLNPIAEQMAKQYGLTIKLIELSTRTEVETFLPG